MLFLEFITFAYLKRMAIILLLLIYGSSTIGATVQLHYCMDELVGWSFYCGKNEKCPACGMEKHDEQGCCKDEQRSVKLKSEHRGTGMAVMQFIDYGSAIVDPYPSFILKSDCKSSGRYSRNHEPPDIARVDRYIFHCLFLI